MDFGPVIDTYTRSQAIADGVLVEVPDDLAREAGLRAPVALTRAAWDECVRWTEEDTTTTGIPQQETARLRDVLYMASLAIRLSRRNARRRAFTVSRVPRPGAQYQSSRVDLVVAAGPGDQDELALTIMLRGED